MIDVKIDPIYAPNGTIGDDFYHCGQGKTRTALAFQDHADPWLADTKQTCEISLRAMFGIDQRL